MPKKFPAPEPDEVAHRTRVVHPRVQRGATTRVNHLRIARDLTIAELARLCHFTVRTVSRVMRDGVGRTRGAPIRLDTRIRIATVLGGDPLELWPELAASPGVIVRRVEVPAPAPVPPPITKRARRRARRRGATAA